MISSTYKIEENSEREKHPAATHERPEITFGRLLSRFLALIG